MAHKFDFKDSGIDDIFQNLASHQMTALTLHSSMVELFNFLNFDGFKCWQEERVLDEYDCYKKISNFYQKMYNKINPKSIPQDLDVIPSDWYNNYTRFDVTKDAKRKMVEMSFTKWRDWERETLDFLQSIICRLDELGEVVASDFVHELAEGVKSEIEDLEEVFLDLKAANYELDYILLMQKEIKKKYK